MQKILFYHCNDSLGLANAESQLYLGVSALYLKTYIDKTNPEIAQQLEWLVPLQRKMSDKELIDYINQVKPDFFCTSNYIWNHSFIMEQLARIKNFIPKETVIVSGGPSIDVNIDNEFFKKHPYIDYAIYGAGEVAFNDIITSKVIGKKLIAFNTSNCAWLDKNNSKQIVADFKYVPQLAWSPYLSNEDYFASIVKNEQNNNISIILPYDLTRGCPYSCTFCDWNSGLTNKTTRRKGTYKEEIDLFHKLKIKNLYLSDANVGQYDEDIDMISYLVEKNINNNAGFKIDGNFSKLRKENNLKIYHLMAKGNLFTDYTGFTISVQDINLDVLKNIDRPDVGWPVHRKIIRELKEYYPWINSKVQLIQGLPGQTVASWRSTLRELAQENLQLQIFISELLPASPAARDIEYQKKFNFKYSTSLRFNRNEYYRGKFPESCFSFTKADFVEMTILSHLYTAITIVKDQWYEDFDCEIFVDYFLKSPNYQAIKNNLWTNWNDNDGYYYTIDFSGRPKNLSACFMHSVAAVWAMDINFVTMLIRSIYSGNDIKTAFKKMFVKNGNSHKADLKILQGYQ